MKLSIFEVAKPQPSIIGTGLLALDIVITEDAETPLGLWAGGTCGNILTILSYLNWYSIPIARLGDDQGAQLVRHDLKKWGVCLERTSLEPQGSTPIFLHYIRKNGAGQPVHRFARACPKCGTTYPGYKPVHATAAADIVASLVEPQVFFLDRLSRGALNLAKSCAQKGAIVVFEPSGIKDESLFNEALDLAHIVKYANDRLTKLDIFGCSLGPLIEIQTLGNAGLTYRSRIDTGLIAEWQHVDAFAVANLRDTAGAGDWCTAGIIHAIGQRGIAGLRTLRPEQLYEALCFGQALAAWNCCYEGARGGMYQVSKEMFHSDITSILRRTMVPQGEYEKAQQNIVMGKPDADILHNICPVCSLDDIIDLCINS